MPLAPVLEIDSSTLVITAGLQYVTKGAQNQVVLVYNNSKPLILNQNGTAEYQAALYSAIKTAMDDVTPVTLPAPTITTPNSGTPFTVTYFEDLYQIAIVGTNFLPGCKIVIDDTEFSVAYTSSTNISTNLIAAGAIPVGTYDLKVVNPDGQIATSVSAIVVSSSGAPTISSVTPDHGDPIDSRIGDTIVVIGTNFLNGATFSYIDGVNVYDDQGMISPLYISDTEYHLSDQSLSNGGLPAGTYDVKYTGPDGQTVTLSAAFSVT